MPEGIVAFAWVNAPSSFDNSMTEHTLQKVRNSSRGTSLIERGRTCESHMLDIFKLLVDDYEIREMSCD